MEKPMFDYEKLLYESPLIPYISNPLQHPFKHKHLWVKKPTGLGVTEFFLRLIKRMKVLFEPHNIIFDSKETALDGRITGPSSIVPQKVSLI
jgi:hypothetical protein